MSLITNRTSENATVKIDYSQCNHCGLCVNVCKDLTLIIKDEKVIINSEPLFGCIGCGQCVAICPNDAISLNGRTLTMEEFIHHQKSRELIIKAYTRFYFHAEV